MTSSELEFSDRNVAAWTLSLPVSGSILNKVEDDEQTVRVSAGLSSPGPWWTSVRPLLTHTPNFVKILLKYKNTLVQIQVPVTVLLVS